ncbi:MAG TPA: O-antigen ligase family protein [Thermoanaerobaculia bacterium]|nr:O-antigen ligase family protein [Thermoanaerobaculia bacterium]
MGAWVGLVPAMLAALFAGWCGNLLGGVTAAGSVTALGALLLTLAACGGPWRDPLRLGRTWRLAPLGLWFGAAASAWLSPVPRAGLEAVVLLPAYLCLPAAIARCWQGRAARRLGARGMAAAVALLAAWALFAQRGGGEVGPGASEPAAGAGGGPATPGPGVGASLAPLGHHTLLATWLVTLLPIALLTLREKTAWRWLGAGAGALGVAGVMAGRSLAGGAGLACEALAAALWVVGRAARAPSPKARPGAGEADPAGGGDPRAGAGWRARRRLAGGLVLLGLVLAASQLPRAARIAAGHDASVLARGVYIQAGWNGWRERPWLGWGPGSVPWTAGWFLVPRPGLNPWGEAVGELHSLPVQLAYETGALGLLCVLITGGSFLARRWTERRAASDGGLLAAGCLGLAGAAAAWLGTAAIAVPALPLALAAAAGAALAGGAAIAGPGAEEPRFRLSKAACVYGLAVATALLPPEIARWHYDRAVAAGQAGRRPAAESELTAAVRLDPRFPLYRMRLALLRAGSGTGPGAAALALTAARDAQGVGLLWLVAGILGRADGEVWAPAALEQGCALDPLSPFPAFYLMASAPAATAAPRLGARALLAEPRLMAATFWEGREPLFRQVLEEARRWPGLDAGWKLALLHAAPGPAARRGAIVRQELIIDAGVFTQATSLHLFRRLPWLARWQLVRLRESLIEGLDMPPATSLRSTDGARFATRSCGPAS